MEQVINSKKFVIIDGNAIIHRAYHAIPPLTTKKGEMVNAVYGFTSMLLKIYADLKPDYLAVSFDVSGGTFRDKLYKEYKAKRVKADQELYDQIPLVHDVVRAFGIPIYSKEGFEADDVIGTVVHEVRRGTLKAVDFIVKSIIVTGDMDMLQLVDDNETEVYLLRRGLSDFELYNETKVIERFGFGPSLIVDYKSLRGDSSDNIPGVPGIGEKTAVELIQKIGGIKEIYEKMEKQKEKLEELVRQSVVKKLENGKDLAFLSQQIATIDSAVPNLNFNLENCAVREFDREKILAVFQNFGFMSLAKRLPGAPNIELAKSGERKAGKTKQRVAKIIHVDENNIADLASNIKKAGEFACAMVFNGSDIFEGELAGLVCLAAGQVYYLDVSRIGEKSLGQFFSIFGDQQIQLVGHDLKQLIKVLARSKVVVSNKLFDIMIASYLLNSGSRAHDLQSITLRELGRELQAVDQGSLFGVDPALLAEQLIVIVEVQQNYISMLAKQSLDNLFENIEMALVPVLAEMELAGVAIDSVVLSGLSREVAKTIKKLTKKIHEEAGEEFNISSSVQLRDILYEKLGLKIPGIKKGKTGYSTAASELEKMRGAHPIIELVEEYREVTKLQNTYIDVLPTLVNKKTGRIHTNFNQAVTTTGRLSSSDPNLQNIPIRTKLGREIRDAFVAEPGNLLVSADYSQIELRIVASLAQDIHLIEIFKQGQDVHSATAAAINNVPISKVTREMRYAAKEVNFGILYGMGAFGLSWRAGIPQWQARDFIDKYFHEFSGVKAYIDKTLEFARKEGYVETLFGRRRYIPELISNNFQLKSAGERMAVNMPVQGTAADLMKMAMIAVHKKVNGIKPFGSTSLGENNVRLILQVHDELVWEVRENLAADVATFVKKEMEAVAKLQVPIEVNVKIGTRWGELK